MMMHDTHRDGRLVERADDESRMVTTYDDKGNVTGTRPYDAAENAAADLAAAEAAAQAAHKAGRLAARAILDTINANLDEARAAKAAAQAVLDATAPTNVAQAWTRIKDTARALKDTDNALISVGQGVKDLAKYVAP